MNKRRHDSTRSDAPPPEGGGSAHLSAYRSEEASRRVDPFRSAALQSALAHEAERRAAAQRGGLFGRALGWIANAPRPALAGAALSFALLVLALPLGGPPLDSAELQRSEMLMVGADGPEAGSAESVPAGDLLKAEPLAEWIELPWLTVAGGVGLAVSLLAAERARRRRRA